MVQYLKVINIDNDDIRTLIGYLMVQQTGQPHTLGEFSIEMPSSIMTDQRQIALMSSLIDVQWLHQRERHHIIDKIVPFNDLRRQETGWVEMIVNPDFLKLCERIQEEDLWQIIATILRIPPPNPFDNVLWQETTKEALAEKWLRFVNNDSD